MPLRDPEAIIEEMGYSLTNPVKDGLVRDYRKWPGVCSRPGDWARGSRDVERPEYFFDQTDDDWPTAPLQFTVRPMRRDRPLPLAIEGIEAHLRQHQTALCEEHAQRGRGFLGVKAVLNTDPFDSPDTIRPKGKRNPTVAAGGNSEMLQAGVRVVRAFRERYRAAWADYRADIRDVVFPPGTLLMRALHSVCCDELEAPWCAAARAG